MTTRLADYLPIEIIFNLLCVCRRGFGHSMQALRAAMYRRNLHFGSYLDFPRLTFWIQLTRNASLLDETWPPYPSLFANDWFVYPLEKQIWTLVYAWMSVPKGHKHLRVRERLIDKLLMGAGLGVTDKRELPGLRALGVCGGDQLSAIGQAVLGKSSQGFTYLSQAELWRISGDRLYVPFPPKWELLWQLETFLDPVEPGVYSLSPEALRGAVQRGALEGLKGPRLISVLENGLGKSMTSELLEVLVATPGLRVLPGPVLEFHDPQELLRLREAASFRRDMREVISPRHIHLDPWQAARILRRLYRQGLLSLKDLEMVIGLHPALRVRATPGEEGGNTMEQSRIDRNKRVAPVKRPLSKSALSKAERIYLLSLLLFAEGLKAAHTPPPGLLLKLTADLDTTSRGASARQATELLEQVSPRSIWIQEEEPPPQPEEEILTFLEQAIPRGETIDVLYQASGRKTPELRHLTPLLVEQRGPRYYLIAYCHTRRANRTFRLDRLRLIDFPAEL